jgi:hypothetical protein
MPAYGPAFCFAVRPMSRPQTRRRRLRGRCLCCKSGHVSSQGRPIALAGTTSHPMMEQSVQVPRRPVPGFTSNSNPTLINRGPTETFSRFVLINFDKISLGVSVRTTTIFCPDRWGARNAAHLLRSHANTSALSHFVRKTGGKTLFARLGTLVVLAVAVNAIGASPSYGTSKTIQVRCGTGKSCTDTQLQSAIDNSTAGEIILVHPGTYEGELNFDGKSVTVKSTNGPRDTVLDGEHKLVPVTINSGETSGAVLEGLTIQDGYDEYFGGGLIISGGSSPIIRHDVIQDNTACSGGAGMYISDASPLISDDLISDNIGGSAVQCGGYLAGGGILVGGSSSPDIEHNVIVGNEMDSGAGIATDGGAPLIEDNVVEDNSDNGQGGSTGLELFNSQTGTMVVQNIVGDNEGAGTESSAVRIASLGRVTLLNNTIVATNEYYAVWEDSSDVAPVLINNIVDGDQVSLGCGDSYSTDPYLSHNDISGSSAPTGVCSQLISPQSNLTASPKFVDSSMGNYKETGQSPTVGSGETSDSNYPFTLPERDLDGKPRTIDGTVDIGAFEFRPKSK